MELLIAWAGFVGAWLLFAFGKMLVEWWDVLEPCSLLHLEKSDELAGQMAGMGMVKILGFHPGVPA